MQTYILTDEYLTAIIVNLQAVTDAELVRLLGAFPDRRVAEAVTAEQIRRERAA